MERELRPTAGARALARYLRSQSLSISRFSEQNGLDRIQVQRAIKGESCRYSVDFALRIERATRGAVRIPLWASETAKVEARRAA